MVRVFGAVVPLLLALAAVSPAEADPPTCLAGDGPDAFFQDDAGSGADAPDDPLPALHLIGNVTLSGGLTAPTPEGPGDQSDWYAFSVDENAEYVMAELDSYTVEPAFAQITVVDVVGPSSDEPLGSVVMSAPRAAFPAEPGEWSFRVRFVTASGASCEASQSPIPAPPEITALLKTYTLYIGCDPVCV